MRVFDDDNIIVVHVTVMPPDATGVAENGKWTDKRRKKVRLAWVSMMAQATVHWQLPVVLTKNALYLVTTELTQL